MRFEGTNEREVRNEARADRCLPASQKLAAKSKVQYEEFAALKNLVGALLFEAGCFECNRMAAIPQGAFAVLQVRKNFERANNSVKYQQEQEEEKETRDSKNCGFNAKVLQEGRELTPLKYNSKLMNSIWGLYNRYSVHNFKKIDANEAGLLAAAAEACWGVLGGGSPVAAEAAEVGITGSSAGH